MFGYEGTDVFEIIKNVRVPSCFPVYVEHMTFTVDAFAVKDEALLLIHRARERRILLPAASRRGNGPQEFDDFAGQGRR